MMFEGKGTFGDCLKAAMVDTLTKERSFTTPSALTSVTGRHVTLMNQGAEMSHPEHSNAGGGGHGGGNSTRVKKEKRKNKHEKKGDHEKNKHGGKGHSKGVGKQGARGGGGASGCASATAAGKPICFAYNDKTVKCQRKDCKFAHACGKCLADGHPMFACRGNFRAPGETQGSGQGTQ